MIARQAVVRGGALVAGPEAGRAVPWWSVGKIALAAAALLLVQEGALALDEGLPGRTYTLRQLLQHRAGLTTYGGPAYLEAVAAGAEPWPIAELRARTDADRLRYEPGTGWAYSNIGYLEVRELIEAATREPLARALPRLVLRPLGLAQARLAETPADLAEVDWVGTPDSAPYHPGWVYHGLIVGPLAEAAFLVARLFEGRLLAPDLLAAMTMPHRLGDSIPARPWCAPGYGLGVMAGEDRDGRPVIGHTGAGPGSVIAAYHRPGGASAACVLASDDQGAVEEAALATLAAAERG